VALSVVGCSKLHEERTVQVAPGEERTLVIDAPKRDQKVQVDFSSPGVAVNVYVLLEKDDQAARKAIDAGTTSDKMLASQLKAEQGSLQATIPGGNNFLVVVVAASTKTANVTVKINGS
jgi:hypothetical protein